MKIDCLVRFLMKWTNYDWAIDENEISETELEFMLQFPYLLKNQLPVWLKMYGLTCEKALIGTDEESWILLKEECLIHPVIVAQEIRKVLKELNKDFRELYYEYGWAGQLFEDFCLIGEL